MTPRLVTFHGWLDRWDRCPDITAQLSEFNPHKIVSPFRNGGWPNWRWVNAAIDRQLPGGEYVALGFSWGAHAAARLAERDPRCVGLVFVSGLEFDSNAMLWDSRYYLHGADKFPILCLSTQDEKRAIVDGVAKTAQWFDFSQGCNVTYTGPAPNPGTHKRPHMAGVAHHRPVIREWWDEIFNQGD